MTSRCLIGISAFYHDSAACLIRNGDIVAAAQEERFTRKKGDDAFPAQAVDFCLAHAGTSLDDIEAIVFYDKPLIKPVDLMDSIAFNVSRGGMPWAQAKMMAGASYASRGKPDSAAAEYDGLIRDEPGIEIAYRLAGRALLAANQPDRARPYLEKAYSLQPTGFTAFALGTLAMQAKNLPRAISLLQQSLQLTPDMPGALYQLSLAYGLSRDIDRARSTALRLAQIAPNYPGLAQWMTAMGMVLR